jgi:hypothetical protein
MHALPSVRHVAESAEHVPLHIVLQHSGPVVHGCPSDTHAGTLQTLPLHVLLQQSPGAPQPLPRPRHEPPPETTSGDVAPSPAPAASPDVDPSAEPPTVLSPVRASSFAALSWWPKLGASPVVPSCGPCPSAPPGASLLASAPGWGLALFEPPQAPRNALAATMLAATKDRVSEMRPDVPMSPSCRLRLATHTASGSPP